VVNTVMKLRDVYKTSGATTSFSRTVFHAAIESVTWLSHCDRALHEVRSCLQCPRTKEELRLGTERVDIAA
jgi:hypothetical protein